MAFAKIDRRNFLPAAVQDLAGADSPVPIGYGQTNSQPTTVELMLEWLDVQPGNKVLDVGSGSGWTTCLISYLTGSKGWVYAVELIPELVEIGRENAERLSIKNASFHQAESIFGLPEYAPFDRILVSASADKLPQELVEQLKPKGKMVIPVQHSVLEISKDSKNRIEVIEHPGFVFVPLL